VLPFRFELLIYSSGPGESIADDVKPEDIRHERR